MKAPALRRVAQVLMLVVAAAVMADGFWGRQVTPVNLAGVLLWIHWRALSIIALLLVGNLFCMACPFTLVRDAGRLVLPAKLRWPRTLRSKWLPVALLIVFFWAYEAFNLWNSPWLTACMIAGYFLAALVVDGAFRGASFCKYVCPIGQYHFVTSLVSPREIAVRDRRVCSTCSTYDCIRGNDKVRGCELYLFQPRKASSLDCTFCLDCVKACPHDNVSMVSVVPGATLTSDPYRSSIGRLSRRTDMATLALVIVFAAFVNATGMVAPVMTWEHGWHARLGPHTMPLIVAAFVVAGMVAAPAIAVGLCGYVNRLTESLSDTGDVIRRFVYALVPVGAGMWAAHFLFHLITASLPDHMTSGWLTPVQILILDAGLMLSIYLCWRIGKQIVPSTRSALALAAPWAGLASLLYLAGVWILFQPMEMRGMVH